MRKTLAGTIAALALILGFAPAVASAGTSSVRCEGTVLHEEPPPAECVSVIQSKMIYLQWFSRRQAETIAAQAERLERKQARIERLKAKIHRIRSQR